MSNSTPLLIHLLLLLLPLLLQLHLSIANVASDQSECTDQLVGLATCLPYVQGGSKAPTPDCCTGLKEVLKKSPKCLCVLIKDRDDPQLGLKIDLPRALGLPSVCSAPAKISECPKVLKMDPNSPEAKVFTQPQSAAKSTASNSTTATGKGNTTTAAHEKSGAITLSFRKVENVGLLLFLFSLFFFI